MRLPNSVEGAERLAELLSSDRHKAVLGTLVMILPAFAPRTIVPFPGFLLPGNGPTMDEADSWEETFTKAAVRVQKDLLSLGADGAVRGHWLRRHLVVLDARVGGAATRYRPTAAVDLADGECAVVIRWQFIEFVAVRRWVEAEDVREEPQTLILLLPEGSSIK
jgi:hypothetical protein